jgi:dTMP kinase
MARARGKFITVEGIEGTGKSTNIDFLTSLIERNGFEVFRTREPGGTPMAERIRALLLEHGNEPLPEIAELLLFFASRSLHLRNAIVPALDEGKWVLCDRFTDASRAYQGSGRGLDPERIERLADWVQEGLEPDMTILLDAPAEIGMQRAAQRGDADRMDSQELSFYRRVRAGYLALADQYPERFVVVDARQSLALVQDAMAAKLARLFEK